MLDLVDAGRKVAEDLGINGKTIYNWRRQDRIDNGLEPGLTTAEKAELGRLGKPIAEFDAELAVHRRATELLKKVTGPKAVRGHRGDGSLEAPAQLACRVLDVSESGFYAWRPRSPSRRAIRRAWLTEVPQQRPAKQMTASSGLRAERCCPTSDERPHAGDESTDAGGWHGHLPGRATLTTDLVAAGPDPTGHPARPVGAVPPARRRVVLRTTPQQGHVSRFGRQTNRRD